MLLGSLVVWGGLVACDADGGGGRFVLLDAGDGRGGLVVLGVSIEGDG